MHLLKFARAKKVKFYPWNVCVFKREFTENQSVMKFSLLLRTSLLLRAVLFFLEGSERHNYSQNETRSKANCNSRNINNDVYLLCKVFIHSHVRRLRNIKDTLMDAAYLISISQTDEQE